MKFKLPLLLLLSLMWQAATLADEWTNIATAVTGTEGRLCAGELAADGTGTDILCDDDHPAIDSSGNVTVSGELSATTLNATQLCDENGTNCTTLSGGLSGVSALASLTDVSVSTPADNNLLRYNTSTSKWEAVGINDGLSTTTMVSGFPDAILCGAGTERIMVWHSYITGGDIHRYYRNRDQNAADRWISFNADGSANTSDDHPSGIMESDSDCVGGSASISALYTAGKAFNFLGNNGAQISLTEIADVSASAPTDGQALVWDDSEGEWVAGSAGTTINSINDIDDVSASDAVAGSILRYDGASWTAVADLSSALSTTTMVPGLPDAIRCTANGYQDVLYPIHHPRESNSQYVYRRLDNSSANEIEFNAAGDIVESSGGYTDCTTSHTAADLYANGQAFNFLGNNGAQTSMTEIADVSASAPTEGQLLSYDASENEWVATDVISKTIIYNSIDEEPCVVTGGVQKLSFNPTTGRLRVCRP